MRIRPPWRRWIGRRASQLPKRSSVSPYAARADWNAAAQFVRRFALAFKVEDGVQLSIGAFGDPRAHTIASRVERILEKAGVTAEACADIDIADYDDETEWAAVTSDARFVDIASLADRSPSALRRILKATSA